MNIKKELKRQILLEIREQRIIQEEKEILGELKWLGQYTGKYGWNTFRDKPIDFNEKYSDFKRFLKETDGHQVNIDWLGQDGTKPLKVLRIAQKLGWPADYVHGMSNTISKLMSYAEKFLGTIGNILDAFTLFLASKTKIGRIAKLVLAPFATGEGKTPRQIHSLYIKELKKDHWKTKEGDFLIKAYQLIIEYEYEQWKSGEFEDEWGGLKKSMKKNKKKLDEKSKPCKKGDKLNKPVRTSGENKKFKVCVKDGDKIKTVRFGDPNMKIKKSNPKRRKSFRARHKCDNPGPKTKARYWSCKKW